MLVHRDPQDLRSKLSRAESIMKLSGMCRKLETEQEKVLPFHTLAEAVPVPQQPHLAQWEEEEQEDQHVQQDQQVQQGMQGLHVSLPQQQQQQRSQEGWEPGRLSQASSLVPWQQQQRWSAVGLDDNGQPVADCDYLNRCLCMWVGGWHVCAQLQALCMQSRPVDAAGKGEAAATLIIIISDVRNLAVSFCVSWSRFFKRYNKVVLDVAAINKERGRLEQENTDLRQLLKTFLDGIRWVATVSQRGDSLLRNDQDSCGVMLGHRQGCSKDTCSGTTVDCPLLLSPLLQRE